MNFSIGDDGDFVGIQTGKPSTLNVLPTSTGSTTSGGGFDWSGLTSGLLQFGTAAVNTYGTIKQGELAGRRPAATGGMIPGLDKTQSYLVLGGAGLLAVIVVFALLKK